MKITVEKLKELGACNSGIKYFKSKHSKGVELTDLIREDIATNDSRILGYANWLVERCITCEQHIDYIIYGAELVLPKYNKIYPNDCRIRNYIQLIKDFRDGKITREQLLGVADIAFMGYAVANAFISDRNAIMIKILEYGVTLLED